MAGVNKVILIGNLGADPEVRHLQNGTSVANFRLATTEKLRVRVTGADGQENWESREQTEWHNVVAWRGLATIVERYVRKGSKVYVEGKLRTRQYQDKEGKDRYITEIVADEMTMLDRASGDGGERSQQQGSPAQQGGSQQQQPAMSATAQQGGPDNEMDDLPF